MLCKIFVCSVFPDIPDTTGRKTRRRGRRTETIEKPYAFDANSKNSQIKLQKM